MWAILLAIAAFTVLLLTAGLVNAWLQVRQMRWRAVVEVLSVVVGQSLPLGRGLRAAAETERASVKAALVRMSRRVERGDYLSTALRVTMPSCPGSVIGAIRGAEEGGTLPTSLRTLAHEARHQPTLASAAAAPTVYSIIMLAFVPLFLVLVLTNVIPKFREIFADFDSQLPPLTVWLIELGAMPQVIAAVLVVSILALGLMHLVLNWSFRGGGQEYDSALASLGSAFMWFLPGLHSMAESRALRCQLPLLSAGVRAGHDLPAVARHAAHVRVNTFARQRLRRWADLIEAGGEPMVEARRLGFPAPLLRAVRSADSPEGLATALEYVTTYYRMLSQHWGRVLLSVTTPLLVLGWGVIVAFIAKALFIPLVTLLDAVMQQIY